MAHTASTMDLLPQIAPFLDKHLVALIDTSLNVKTEADPAERKRLEAACQPVLALDQVR